MVPELRRIQNLALWSNLQADSLPGIGYVASGTQLIRSWSGKVLHDVPTDKEICWRALRSIVVDHFEEHFKCQGVGVAYIYFDYKSQETQSSEAVAACLLRQLAAQVSDLNEQLEKTYDTLSPRLQYPDFDCLVKLLVTCAQSFETSFIIFDALDECDKKQAQQMVFLIRQLCTSESPFKLFTTSRPYLRSVEGFLKPDQTIELHAHESDLRNFIETKFMDDDATKLMDDEAKLELRNMILTRLLDNAKGL